MPNPKHQQFDWRGIELLVDEITVSGTVNGALTGLTTITDNTGGVVSDTIANTAGANPTTAEFENAVASLAAKINAIINAMN